MIARIRRHSPHSAVAVPLLLLAALAACDARPTAPVARPPLQPVASLRIEAAASRLDPGGGVQLVATPLAADRTPLAGRAVTWTSSDPARAAVSARGYVTARSVGEAVVTAASEGRTATLRIVVVAPEVASVRITPADSLLEVGASRRLRAEALTADGSVLPGRAVRWISSDPASLRVDADGLATATREGIQVVNAEIDGVTGWARVVVPPDLSGEWTLAVYDLEGAGVRCRIEGVRATLVRDGLALSGEAHAAPDGGVRVGCDVVGSEPPFATPTPPVGPLAGALTPAVAAALLDVELRFEMGAWLLRGTLIGGAVTGTAWLADEVGGVPVTRRGTFVLTRAR